MASSITIKVTPEQLKSTADQVSSEISNIEKEWNNIGTVIKKTKGYWIGDASDVHQKNYSQIVDDVEKMIKNLKDRPVELLKMAGLYEEAETKNIEVTNTLSSDVIV